MPEREEHGEAIIEFFHKFALANHLTQFVVQSSGSYEVMGAKARASTIIKHLEELKKRCQREDLGYEITEIIQDKDGIEVKSSL